MGRRQASLGSLLDAVFVAVVPEDELQGSGVGNIARLAGGGDVLEDEALELFFAAGRVEEIVAHFQRRKFGNVLVSAMARISSSVSSEG
jgi:hypothetical protein